MSFNEVERNLFNHLKKVWIFNDGLIYSFTLATETISIPDSNGINF